MMPFVRTRLLSPLGKLRVAMDFVIPPRRDEGDESVERFVVRRLGRPMYERIVEPLLSGIFAGDGSRLSVLATFPHLRAAEREHGGLGRSMLAARRRERASRGKAAPSGDDGHRGSRHRAAGRRVPRLACLRRRARGRRDRARGAGVGRRGAHRGDRAGGRGGDAGDPLHFDREREHRLPARRRSPSARRQRMDHAAERAPAGARLQVELV
jgi:hypothetical protein